MTLDSGHLYKWGTFYVIKNVTTNQFLLFPNLNTFLPFLRLGSTDLILTHQGHISKVSKTRVSLQYHFSVNSDFLSNLRYLVSAGDSVFKAHCTQYNIQSHFSSSCWVFQPMGRWFSSQDRKRSFVCHSFPCIAVVHCLKYQVHDQLILNWLCFYPNLSFYTASSYGANAL